MEHTCLLTVSLSLAKLVPKLHRVRDDGRPVVGRESHRVCLLTLLERDNKLVAGSRGLASGSRQDADKVLSQIVIIMTFIGIIIIMTIIIIT